MKKIIGISSVAFFALAMLSKTATSVNDSSLNLNDLLVINSAQAEEGCRTGTDWILEWSDRYQTNTCRKGGSACCQ